MKFCNRQKATSILTVLILVGCNSENAFILDEDADLNQLLASGALYQIDISPSGSTSYLPVQYSAIGKFDGGQEADITSYVTWSTLDNSVAIIDASGNATPVYVGNTNVVASYQGITSDEVTLTIVDTLVCGHVLGLSLSTSSNGGINNNDTNNAAGNCLKVREITGSDDGKTKWMTSSPSLTFVSGLGYTSDTTASNSGDTYFNISTENGSSGPSGDFVLFSQEGQGVVNPGAGDDSIAGVNGQYDRWCQKLASLSFAGESNWRRATIQELIDLDDSVGDPTGGIYSATGWPNLTYYWSKSVELVSEFSFAHYRLDYESSDTPNHAGYATCVTTLD